MDNNNNEDYVTIKEVMKKLSVSRNSIYNWVKTENLPAYRLGKTMRFKMSEVEDWIKKNKIDKVE